MSIFELIGFIVVILALLAPVIRRVLQKRFEKQHPEEYARRKAEAEAREREALRQLFKQVGREIPPELMDEKIVVEVPPARRATPVRVTRKQPAAPKIPVAYDRASPIQKLIERSSGRDMVILHEILEPPVSLR